MQSQPHDAPVYLGFAAPYDTDDLYRLSSCFLPLGKVGGKPSWLNPVAIPKSEELACKSCAKPMCFLLQVYATGETDAAHSFHRTLFLFVCRDPACSKANDASNLAAFRCCLPRVNAWYGTEGPLDPDLIMENEMPPPPAGAPALCRTCGCFASKKCAKCGEAWYCSREHQAFDWKMGHRSACGQPVERSEEERKNPENVWLFEEMGMEMDRENLPSSLFEDLSDDEEEDEEREGEKEEKRRMEEYQKMVKAKKLDEGAAAAMADEDIEVEEKKDVSFDRFNRVMQLQPEQVLRYQRAGRPLIASDRAPEINQVAACSLCGAARQFELQLTPHLLSLMGVDSIKESIDWASVYIYTCSANCAVPENGYAAEAVVKHDFIE